MDLLDKFEPIKVESLVDKIIQQIRDSIADGKLLPGDKLPSERQLSDRFNIGRTYVRDAIKKLEFLGILKTNPQSGTIVSGLEISTMVGLLTNVIKLGKNDFFYMVEARVLMEKFACHQAAIRRDAKNINEMEEALDHYRICVETCLPGVNEDFNFHLKIAEASQNTVIKSLMMIIIPDIITNFRKLNVCGDGRCFESLEDHRAILDCIIKQKPAEAEEAMMLHLKDVIKFSLTYKSLKKQMITNTS